MLFKKPYLLQNSLFLPPRLQHKMICLGLVISLIFFSKLNAQTLKRQSISSTGSYMSDNGISVQQIIGQPYNTSAYYSNNTRYNPGFIQPVFRIETIKSTINATIFPNPASNLINIETTLILEDVVLKIMDMNGKLLLNEKIHAFKTYAIDCSYWTSGVYLISMADSKNDLYSSKLIISR